MKKLNKKISVILLALTLVFSLASCGDSNEYFNEYNENGLNFTLPKYMKELEVKYADLAYGTLDESGLEFMIYFYSRDELMSKLYMDMDTTVEKYADWFVQFNEYENVEVEYDEEACSIVLRYVYENGAERYFFYDYIVRNEYMLYHVTMSCNPEYRETYEPAFDDWASRISLDY